MLLFHHLLLFSSALTLVSPASSLSITTPRPPCLHEYCDKQNALFEWIEENGGYINSKLELTTGPDPSWAIRGVFATAPISSDESIFRLPKKLLLCHVEYCDLVAALSHELSLGQTSFWWPYLSIMEDMEIDLPSVWTGEERHLLSGFTSMPHYQCDMIDMSDKITFRAFQLVRSRNVNDEGQYCMAPLFDSLNHAQIGYENIQGDDTHKHAFAMAASDDINEKQQGFDTYGDFSVHTFFENYGFIPQYPRLWEFGYETEKFITFRMFEEDEDYAFEFNPYDVPKQENMAYVYHAIAYHLSTILATEPSGFALQPPSVSLSRYATASVYREECIKALQIASIHLLRVDEDDYDKEEEDDKEDEVEDGKEKKEEKEEDDKGVKDEL